MDGNSEWSEDLETDSSEDKEDDRSTHSDLTNSDLTEKSENSELEEANFGVPPRSSSPLLNEDADINNNTETRKKRIICRKSTSAGSTRGELEL
jgi:hypothetical protein